MLITSSFVREPMLRHGLPDNSDAVSAIGPSDK
jgi:hypothetical protein